MGGSIRKPEVSAFFHAATGSYAYVVADPASARAAVIDPVLDFDLKSGRTQSLFADALIAHVHEKKLTVDFVLETHAHADHLSAGAYLRDALGAKLGAGARIVDVQRRFKELYGLGSEFLADGSDFDLLLEDGATLALGALELKVIATPGHTPDGVTYVCGNAAFIGDTLFAPDYGSASCDFPGGDARTLYRSIQRILGLPPETRLYQCHDYPPDGREPVPCASVATHRASNVHLVGKDEDAFVAMREARDKKLEMPALLLPAVQVNIRAGALPPAEPDGVSYLKIPVNRF